MAIEVRIPTILRSYTGGAKSVEGAGDTLADLLTDLDGQYPGLRARLVTPRAALHRSSTSTSTTRTCGSSAGSTPSSTDGDTVTILPAVAGGAFGLAAQPRSSARRR